MKGPSPGALVGIGELGVGQLSPDIGGQQTCSLDPSTELGMGPVCVCGGGCSEGSMHRQDSLGCRASGGRYEGLR